MDTVFASTDVMLDPLDVKEYTVEAHSYMLYLTVAVLAPSVVYSLDFFQFMSGDEPNTEIPLC